MTKGMRARRVPGHAIAKAKKPAYGGPSAEFVWRLAERTGLEPATSGVTGQHSNQLNYRSVPFRFYLEPSMVVCRSPSWLTGSASRECPPDIRMRSRNHQLNYRSVSSNQFAETQLCNIPACFKRWQT